MTDEDIELALAIEHGSDRRFGRLSADLLRWYGTSPALNEDTRVHARRILRLRRELARRAYANRPHGKRCACQECLNLHWVWIEHWRRANQYG